MPPEHPTVTETPMQAERQWWTEMEASLNALAIRPLPPGGDTEEARHLRRQIGTALLTANQCRAWLDLRAQEAERSRHEPLTSPTR